MKTFDDLALLVIEKRVGFRKRRIILSTFDAEEVAKITPMYQAASLFERKEGDVFLVLPNGQEYLVSNKHGKRDFAGYGFPKSDQKRFDKNTEIVNYKSSNKKDGFK